MEKLNPETDGASKDIVQENIQQLKQLFPDVFTEGKIDFDALKEVLGQYVDDRPERYSFNWNGKGMARRLAQTPSTGTLRPCPDQSVNWDSTENLFIEGDNLEVLKLLQKSYHKKVKMIYIDPPYNTGKDFVYPDNYRDNMANYLELTGQVDGQGRRLSANAETSGRYHTDWLNMMYPRLKLARNLLRDDGVIFISIDDNEVTNLRKMCDEIFGEENFISEIAWKNVYGGGAKSKHVVKQHEYILMYSKNLALIERIELPPDPNAIKRYTDRDEKYSIRGPYFTQPLATNSMDERPNLRFPIEWNGEKIWPEKQWQWSKDRVENALQNNELVIKNDSGKWSVRYKQYLKDLDGKERGAKLNSVLIGPWSQVGTANIVEYFGNGKIFPFPKPVQLIQHLLSMNSWDDECIILDFFSGSSVTAHAVLNLNNADGGNRRFIVVQLPEPCDEKSEAYKAGYKTIAEIGKERIRRVIKVIEADRAEKAKAAAGGLPGMGDEPAPMDLGFKVFKLDSSNIQLWDGGFENMEEKLFQSIEHIKPDRNEMDVLYELLLKYGLDLPVPVEERTLAGSTVSILGYGALVACLAESVSLETVEGIAQLKEELRPEMPMRVVFLDRSFKDDVVKTNALQILKQAGIDDVKSL